MPNIVQGNIEYQNQKTIDFSDINTEYEYPEGLDLEPGSVDHNRIKTRILERARESSKVMSSRYDSWNTQDKVLTAYIRTSDKEKDIKTKDDRKPVSILFPYSYAMMETMLSYMVGAFFNEPIFRYEGYSPEDTVGSMLMELVIQLHCNRFKVPLNLHTMFRDALSYGMGIVNPAWGVKMGYKTRKQEGTLFDINGRTLQTAGRKVRSTEEVLFEGNKLGNVDPYMFLPDPNPGTDIQSGEYVGWVTTDNFISLKREEQHDEDMFNVDYIRACHGKTSVFATDNSEREKKTNKGSRRGMSYGSTNRTDVISMYIDLIPNDEQWKLGDSDKPEKWYFELACDEVVIKAKPAGFNHNMFSVALCAPEFDGYTPTPVSRLEMMSGMQETLDWLFNSHIANVRKAINDMLVVDPYLVNINDLRDPGPGALIRLRRPAWGRGVDKVVQQLGVQDITRANIGDSTYITNWMERVSGIDASVMGGLRQGGPERLTKAEFQGTRAGNIGRLERVARVIGLQAMQDIGYMFASNCQQLMSEDVYVKAVGDHQEEIVKSFGGQRKGKVTPYDLLVDYDVVVRDGSIPGGNFSDGWTELFSTIVGVPELAKELDVPRIFMYIAKQLGAKNVEDFRRNLDRVQPQVVPDDQIEQEVDRGNITAI